MNSELQSQDQPKLPFLAGHGLVALKIGVESDGRGGTVYYFDRPSQTNKKENRAKRVHSADKEVIQKLAAEALAEVKRDTAPLTHEEFESLKSHHKLVLRLERQLESTGMSLEMLIGQTLPTLRLLIPQQVTLAQALEAGRAFYVPAYPMTFDELIDDLVPRIARTSTVQYANTFKNACEPLRVRFKGRYIHPTRRQELEKLLGDVEAGLFLTATAKKKILSRNKWKSPPVKDGHEKWFSDKTLVHSRDAWRRVFLRAKAIGAWPLLQPLPTEVIEDPKADLSACDWALLLPALDKEMLRLVALLLADLRSAEADRLNADDLVLSKGVPISVNVQPFAEKGRKGRKKGRVVTLDPYTSVLLSLAMPQGVRLFSRPVKKVMEGIYAKARKLGIEPTHNCFRRMRHTYYHGLVNAVSAFNKYGSHSKEIVENLHQGAASFEDCYRVFTTLPPETPPHLKCLVMDWAGHYWRKLRGEPIPSAKDLDLGGQTSSAGSQGGITGQ